MTINVYESTMEGLESGLQVRHIATLGQELYTCQIDDEREIQELFADSQFEHFDYIPVRKGNSIIGVVSRDKRGKIKNELRPLDESNLISSQEPLANLFPLMITSSYRLVLQGASIQGIITKSDLSKLPVRLFVFTIVTHLELLMAEIIRAKYPDSQDDNKWLELLKKERQNKIKDKQQDLARGNNELPLLEYTDFCDKRDLVKQIAHLSGKFKDDFEKIEKHLRNKLAHAGE